MRWYVLRRLGASVDWRHERFTLNEDMSPAVREAFVRLFEKGLIYRGPRLINEQTREEMRRILGEIQDGTFTRELVEEFDAGKPNFLKRREAEHNEQIEQVGARLRPLMSWLDEDE